MQIVVRVVVLFLKLFIVSTVTVEFIGINKSKHTTHNGAIHTNHVIQYIILYYKSCI